MSPILYNFAINPLLQHLEKLSGVMVEGQPLLKVLAFANNCVFGIQHTMDSLIATAVISNYEAVSQAKLNVQKSIAISKSNPPTTLPFNIHVTKEPIYHLGILVDSSGISSSRIESDLLAKMQKHIAQWKYFQPTLKGCILFFNTFVSSKLWFFV